MTKYIISAITGYLMTVGVLVAGQYTYYSVMPYDHWFHYDDFYPVKTVYQANEPITFISEAEVYRPVEIEWKDILRCKYDGVFQYTSVYYSSKMFEEPTVFQKNETPQSWVWSGPDPVRPTECYGDSSACALLPFGIKKCQQGVTEEIFTLLP